MNTKAKLEQCQADIAKITAERDGLQEELDKTKLRSWDYGVLSPASNGDFRFFLQQDGKIKAYTPSGCVGAHDAEICRDIYTIFGNLKADLERNSKDLKKFKVVDTYGDTFVQKWYDDYLCIRSSVEGKTLHMHLAFDGMVEFHQKLGQLIATAKRRQNAK